VEKSDEDRAYFTRRKHVQNEEKGRLRVRLYPVWVLISPS
jgi:hypothetical protein